MGNHDRSRENKPSPRATKRAWRKRGGKFAAALLLGLLLLIPDKGFDAFLEWTTPDKPGTTAPTATTSPPPSTVTVSPTQVPSSPLIPSSAPATAILPQATGGARIVTPRDGDRNLTKCVHVAVSGPLPPSGSKRWLVARALFAEVQSYHLEQPINQDGDGNWSKVEAIGGGNTGAVNRELILVLTTGGTTAEFERITTAPESKIGLELERDGLAVEDRIIVQQTGNADC
jgi:hypothetical protein